MELFLFFFFLHRRAKKKFTFSLALRKRSIIVNNFKFSLHADFNDFSFFSVVLLARTLEGERAMWRVPEIFEQFHARINNRRFQLELVNMNYYKCLRWREEREGKIACTRNFQMLLKKKITNIQSKIYCNIHEAGQQLSFLIILD